MPDGNWELLFNGLFPVTDPIIQMFRETRDCSNSRNLFTCEEVVLAGLPQQWSASLKKKNIVHECRANFMKCFKKSDWNSKTGCLTVWSEIGNILNIFWDFLKGNPFKTSFNITFVTTFQTLHFCEKL